MAFIGRTSTAENALTSVGTAFSELLAVNRLDDCTLTATADEALRLAIDAALEAGHSWGAIGECLGMARGNAYQKYRRRPRQAMPPLNAPPL